MPQASAADEVNVADHFRFSPRPRPLLLAGFGLATAFVLLRGFDRPPRSTPARRRDAIGIATDACLRKAALARAQAASDN